MSWDGYLELWTALLLDWRVLFAVGALFAAGAFLRFVAFGRRNPGAFKQPILKFIKKMSAQGQAGAAGNSPPKGGNDEMAESDDVGLDEEAYPTDEPDDKPGKGRRT